MSIRVMQWVFENSKSKGTARLVALALADHADQDGKCWPSWARIQKYANMSRRAIAAGINALEALGEIEVKSQAAAHRSNYYFFRGVEGAESAPYHNRNSAKSAPLNVQNLHLEGAKSAPGTVIEPSGEPSEKIVAQKAATFPGAFYEQVETAFATACDARIDRAGKKWVNTAVAGGRSALIKLFRAGEDPAEVATRASCYAATADGKYRPFSICGFVANYNNVASRDKKEVERDLAADGHWK